MDTSKLCAMLSANAMSAAPTFSVIIVCKNPAQRLRVALESVWSQSDAPVELIVVDGNSTDGTREWLETQRGRIATLISEPDTGVYDAMNKGINAAHGQWILFLGADDRLANDRVLRDASAWLAKTDAAFIGGEALFEDGRSYRLEAKVNPIRRNFVHHQAAFYRRTVFEMYGKYDPTLKVMADYEFNLRLWGNRARFESIPLHIAVCGAAGLSDSGAWRGYREEIQVRHRHFSPISCAFWDIGSFARFTRKKIIRSLPRHHG